ncbi:MAG: decaprenyl-phosphate phosphoribosyltransferase [Anaerolineaceae bacterium]|nr:decaprenyl-phosphate phosphoribosyltransferase [Anaerolineaceae bacterium]
MFQAIIKEMRPKQWAKNVFLLAAIIFDRQLTNPEAIFRTAAGFVLFSLLSSCVYIINDLSDIEADRNHPKKKNRPIAAGKISIPLAISVLIGLLIVSFSASWMLSPSFSLIALIYFLINLAYSKWLKHIPLIDVMIIATGFVLRVAAGVSLIQVERFSPWLYVVSTLLALFIALGKRRSEIVLLADDANSTRKVLDGYTLGLLDQLMIIVSSTTIMGYCLYSFSAPNLPDNHTMMLTIPFVLYGIFRYHYLVQVKKEGGAPDELILSDKPLMATGALYGLSVLIIFYLF